MSWLFHPAFLRMTLRDFFPLARSGRFMAACFVTAKFFGACFFRTRLSSSRKLTSSTRWRRFSMPRCARTARAKRAASAGMNEMKYRVCRVVLPPLSLTEMTRPMLAPALPAGMAHPQPFYCVALAAAPGFHPPLVAVNHLALPGVRLIPFFEPQPDIFVKPPLIAFQGQHIISPLVTNFGGDFALAAHRIKRHNRPPQREQIQQHGDVPDLVLFMRTRLLAGHEAGSSRPAPGSGAAGFRHRPLSLARPCRPARQLPLQFARPARQPRRQRPC